MVGTLYFEKFLFWRKFSGFSVLMLFARWRLLGAYCRLLAFSLTGQASMTKLIISGLLHSIMYTRTYMYALWLIYRLGILGVHYIPLIPSYIGPTHMYYFLHLYNKQAKLQNITCIFRCVDRYVRFF